jgi:hypothetical protein
MSSDAIIENKFVKQNIFFKAGQVIRFRPLLK